MKSTSGKNKDELDQAGLKVRKQVLTAEYVDRQYASASEFTLPMQEMATRAWGLVWARPGLAHKTRSMLNIAFLKLMCGASQQVFANQARLGMNESHCVLKLIAETECASGLVVSASCP